MEVGVVTDHVTFGDHAMDKRRVIDNMFADDEEHCLDTMFTKHIENAPSVARDEVHRRMSDR